MKEQVEVVIVINAGDIEKNKLRGDLGITYDVDVLRLIDVFRNFGLYVGSVVLTCYQGQPVLRPSSSVWKRWESGCTAIIPLKDILPILPKSSATRAMAAMNILKPAVSWCVVTAPGPGSGKMATCLSQLYHEHKRGIQAGLCQV